MQKRLTPDELEALVRRLYVAISGATKEDENKQARVFNGTTAKLFGDEPAYWVTRFLWAVSRKTDALPVKLFTKIDHGKKGYEIHRKHTGFGTKPNRIDGFALIPFIIAAMKLYKADSHPAKETPAVEVSVKEIPMAPVQEQVFDCSHFSDELLAVAAEAVQKELARREEERKRKEEEEARYQAKLESIRQTFKEMAESEGVSWEDIISENGIVWHSKQNKSQLWLMILAYKLLQVKRHQKKLLESSMSYSIPVLLVQKVSTTSYGVNASSMLA